MIFIWPVFIYSILLTLLALSKGEPKTTTACAVITVLLALALVYPDAGRGWF